MSHGLEKCDDPHGQSRTHELNSVDLTNVTLHEKSKLCKMGLMAQSPQLSLQLSVESFEHWA
eukprot:UN14516